MGKHGLGQLSMERKLGIGSEKWKGRGLSESAMPDRPPECLLVIILKSSTKVSYLKYPNPTDSEN